MWPGWQKRLWAPALFVAMCGSGWLVVALAGSCSAETVKNSPAGCFEFWFNRYQTVVGAAVAFAAAWVAVRPVWRQLNLASVQTAVVLQGAISSRINLLSMRASKMYARLEKLSDDLFRGHHDTADTDAFSHWACDMGSAVETEIATLEGEWTENIEGDEATIARVNLVKALRGLENCLYDINRTVHLEHNDELANDPTLQAEAEKAEINAGQELESRIGKTAKAIRDFKAAFDSDLNELRLKRQLLDNTLVASEICK